MQNTHHYSFPHIIVLPNPGPGVGEKAEILENFLIHSDRNKAGF